jgi:glycosyltransferase involved in cell wall biosynthesis
MKLTYIHNREITSTKASLVQTISMCDAFASKGVEINLVLPFVNSKKPDSNGLIKKRFNINNEISLSFFPKITLFNRLNIFGSYFGVRNFLKNGDGNLYYTRNPLIFYLVAKKKLPVIFEAHNSKFHNRIKILDRFWKSRILKASQMDNCLIFISISNALADYWEAEGVPAKKALALHDGFDHNMFKNNISKEDARKKLNLSLTKSIITYTGSLYPDREIENIIMLAKHFSEVQFIVVGGPQVNAEFYQTLSGDKGIINIRFTGPVEHREVPLYLFASDVLLALWSKRVPTINYCSPLKIFEYMAAGRIIVAHGFPSIKEIIRHEENGLLVIPDNFDDLVEKTDAALNHSAVRDMEKTARTEAFNNFTWAQRATSILEKINGKRDKFQ